MRSIIALVLSIVCSGLLAAKPIMTPFGPQKQGFRFANTFVNDFVPALDYHTGGLCGGMVYTALDYYYAKMPIPDLDYRPANGMELQHYLYNRQVDSITSNLDRWAEIGFNPDGIRNGEFFRWGLNVQPGGRIDELRSFIDKGIPAPLGLQGAHNRSGSHQVLAIGYDLGRFTGDLQAFPEDVRIYIYDPNCPNQVMSLSPDMGNQIWVERGANDRVVDGSGWQTYFVNKNYHAQSPPKPAYWNYPADGMIYELLCTFQTGADDLRGGRDNIELTVNLKDGTMQFYPNITLGSRWIANYQETECVRLSAPVPPGAITSIVVSTTFAGGIEGDNWDMLFAQIRAKGGPGLDLPHLAEAGFKRFTGDDRTLVLPVSAAPAPPRGTIDRLQLRFWTGGDDLRGGNDNVGATVVFRDGRRQTFNNINQSQRWADHAVTTVNLPLNPSVLPGDVATVIVFVTFGGGTGGDNWNMDALQVWAVCEGVEKMMGSYDFHRFTGDDRTIAIAASWR